VGKIVFSPRKIEIAGPKEELALINHVENILKRSSYRQNTMYLLLRWSTQIESRLAKMNIKLKPYRFYPI
jgi:YbbR domain-containing protein